VRPELREQEGGAAVARRISVVGQRCGHRLERLQIRRNEYIE
jgi:hypothetical protein